MSIRVINHVLYHMAVKTTAAERWLLLFLADKAGPGGGRIFTSQARLVAWTGLAADTVERSIQRFKQRGWLLEVAKARGDSVTWRLDGVLWKSCGKPSCQLSCGRLASRRIPTAQSPKRQLIVATTQVAVTIRPLYPSLLEGKNGTYVPPPV
jgi:hypothetical protein